MQKYHGRQSKYGILFLFIGILSFLPVILSAQTIPHIKHDHKVRIKEAFNLLHCVGDKIWNGWSEISIPINLVDEEYEYLVGHPAPPEDYIFIENDSYLGKPIYGKRRTTKRTIAAAYPINDIETALIGTTQSLGRSSTRWVLTLLHEMFHVFQHSKGSFEKIISLKLGSKTDPSWWLDFPFPHADNTTRGMIHQLGYALYRIINSESSDTLQYELKTYLEARNAYKELLKLKFETDDNYKYCKFQEWNEGGARYTEGLIAKLAATTDYKPLPEFKRLPDFVSYEDMWKHTYSKQIEEIKEVGCEQVGRENFYVLGAGQALVLEKCEANWKNEYFEKDIWLDDLLEKCYENIVGMIGKPAPDFTLKDISGRKFKLSNYRSKPVLLFFLSAGDWAIPAHRYLPHVNSFVQDFKEKGLVVLGIAVMSEEKEIKQYLKQQKPDFPVLLGTAQGFAYGLNEKIECYRIKSVPTVFLINSNGMIVYYKKGYHEREILLEQLNELFKN